MRSAKPAVQVVITYNYTMELSRPLPRWLSFCRRFRPFGLIGTNAHSWSEDGNR